MSSSDKDFMLDCCLSDLVTIDDFYNLIKVIFYYHNKRCNEDKCHYCCFLTGLYLIYSELKKEESKDIIRLIFYCIQKRDFYICKNLHS